MRYRLLIKTAFLILAIDLILILFASSIAFGQGRWENVDQNVRKFANSEKHLNWKIGQFDGRNDVRIEMLKWSGMPDSTYFHVIMGVNPDSLHYKGDTMFVEFADDIRKVYEKSEGTEFEIILSKPPASPHWTIPIEYSDNIEFNYQNKISELEGGELIDYLAGLVNRPPKVEGSYAIKHINKGGINVDGDSVFRTGKVGHLDRPTAVDATGDTLWLDQLINIDSWTIDGTVDAQWWRDATYPVTIGPTIGISDIGASTLNLTAYAIGMKNGWGLYTASTGDEVDEGFFYGSALGVDVDIAPYTITGAGQLPNNMVGTQATINVSTTPGWYSVAMSTALSNGVAYTACVGEWSAQMNTYYDSSSPNQYLSRDTQDPSDLPATWGENSQRQYDCSFYMNVTSAGGAADISYTRRLEIIKGK